MIDKKNLCVLFHWRFIRRSVFPDLIEFFVEMPCPLGGHQYDGHEVTETYVIEH